MPKWNQLFKSASLLSWAIFLLIPVQMVIFAVSPPPKEVIAIYTNIRDNFILGICNLDLLYLFSTISMGYLYLAFFISLRRHSPVMTLVGLFLGTVGIAVYFCSNVTLEMVQLSRDYFASNISVQEQSELVLLGKAVMTRYMGTAFTSYYLLNGIALLLFTIPMISSEYYKKRTGIWGVIASLMMLVPSNFGTVGMVFSILSLIPTSVWLILTAIDLKKCASLDIE